MDIKFDSLASLDTRSFAKASPADYPDGRYSATILKVDAVTTDSKGKFCFRFRINSGVDKHQGKPNLFVSDQVTFTTRKENEDGSDMYGISWAAVNAFCDLAAIAGADRPSVYACFKQFARACEGTDKTGMRDSMIAIAEYAKLLPGTRVAPNIVWTEDGQYANVRGSKVTPSYLPASNEQDPASSFTGDDCDMERQPAPRRKLKAVRR